MHDTEITANADPASPNEHAAAPGHDAPADLDHLLQERLAQRREAITGRDSGNAGEWGPPDPEDVAFELNDALTEFENAGGDRQAGDVPPPPTQPPDATLSRDAAPPPPRDAAPVPQLPLLSDEQNKTYAAQVAHQTAGMTQLNAFLGTPQGQSLDRTTSAMMTSLINERGAIANLPYGLEQIQRQNLPPDQQRAEVDKVLGRAADYDQKMGRMEGRIDRITAGRDPGPDLPLTSRAENDAFADRSERMRGVLVQANRAMDPNAPVKPDAALVKQTMEALNANRYMMSAPDELKGIEAKNLEPAERSAAVAKVMAPMPDIDKHIDGMQKQLKDFAVAQLGDRAPKPLPGLTPDQQTEFGDRTARMRGMLNHLDRVMDPKAAKQPDAEMKAQTLALLDANRYMTNVPSALKDIAAEQIDPAAKQAKIDKLMEPLAQADKRMDGMAKSINDFYVGKEKVPERLALATPEQSKEYAVRTERMGAMLNGLDKMNDPKLPVAPSNAMQKETLELLRANAYLQELPKSLKALDGQAIDPAAKQAQADKLMAPMAEIDKRMDQMDRRMVGQAAELDAAEKRGTLGRAFDRLKDYGSRAVEAIKNLPDQISAKFSSQTPAHLTVVMGADEAHALPKGVGFQTGGVVDSVEHRDGLATVHYKAGGHDQVLKVAEHSGPGSGPDKQSALAEAVDQLKPGDSFSLKIGREAGQHEVAELTNKTDNFKAVVHDTGAVEKNAQPNVPPKDRAPALGH